MDGRVGEVGDWGMGGMREGVVLVGGGTMYWWVGEWVGGFR